MNTDKNANKSKRFKLPKKSKRNAHYRLNNKEERDKFRTLCVFNLSTNIYLAPTVGPTSWEATARNQMGKN